MRTSESIQELCKALVEFHSEVGRITKDGTNPHLKNRYATIDQIIEEIRPILASKDLFIVQTPTNTDAGEVKMITRIYHTSGQWMESPPLTLKPQKSDPQGIGSAVTYARRYSLTSFLALNTGEDDDGNAASGTGVNQTKKAAPKANGQAKAKPNALTQETVQKIKEAWEKAGFDPDNLKPQLRKLYGDNITEENGRDFLKKLEEMNGGKKDV